MPTLDGWRAIAVLLVIWHHFVRGLYSSEEAYSASVSRLGAFGVDVFFGISGFIITKLLIEEYIQAGHIDFRGFYVRRAFRILPPCFVYLAVVAASGQYRSNLELIGSALFFRNYVPDPISADRTKHLWSLAVEEHFYLFWPLLLTLILARAGRKQAPVAAAWAAIVFGLWRIVNAQYGLAQRWMPQVPEHFRTDLRLDALLWGCVAALILSDRGQRERLRVGYRQWMLWAIATACVACTILYSQLTSLWLPILIPVVLVGTSGNPEWAVSRFLDHPWMQFLGRVSYSLYMWQQLFLLPGWEQRRLVQTAPWNLVAAGVIAMISYRFLEKPCMDLGRRLGSPRWSGARISVSNRSVTAAAIGSNIRPGQSLCENPDR